MNLFKRNSKLSYSELKEKNSCLENENIGFKERNSHLEKLVELQKTVIGNRREVLKNAREIELKREIGHLVHSEKNKVHILIDYQDKVRWMSGDYLKKLGYDFDDVCGRCYTEFLKGDKKELASFFNNHEEQTKELVLVGNLNIKGYVEITVEVIKKPVFSCYAKIKERDVNLHAFTYVSLKKKRVRKVSVETKNQMVKKVKTAISKANKDVDRWMKCNKKI